MSRGRFNCGMLSWACVLAALATVGCSTSTDVPPIGRTPQTAWNVDRAIPSAIRPPAGHPLIGHAIGRGVQVYTAQQDPDDPGRYVWQVSGVDAELFDEDGHVIGRHTNGPTWSLNDGSSVTARRLAWVPMRHAAPWLLLGSTSHDGRGTLADAEYVQRLHTVGGHAPAVEPTASDTGREVRVDYAADYYFYGPVAAK